MIKDHEALVQYKGEPVDNKFIDTVWNITVQVSMLLGAGALAFAIFDFAKHLF